MCGTCGTREGQPRVTHTCIRDAHTLTHTHTDGGNGKPRSIAKSLKRMGVAHSQCYAQTYEEYAEPYKWLVWLSDNFTQSPNGLYRMKRTDALPIETDRARKREREIGREREKSSNSDSRWRFLFYRLLSKMRMWIVVWHSAHLFDCVLMLSFISWLFLFLSHKV